jgi:carboxypeptidase D
MMFSTQFSAAFVLVNRRVILILGLVFLLSACDFLDDNDESKVSIDAEVIYAKPNVIDDILFELSENQNICYYQYLGDSTDGNYPISLLKISDNVQSNEPEPKILIVGAIHGDEQPSSYIPLKLIDYLTNQYEKNPQIQKLVNNYEFHFVTVMNPYGLENEKRYTANNVDLNRNFSWAWIPYSNHGNQPFDQKESQIIRDLGLENAYSLTLTFHSGSECISTPWDYIGTVDSEGSPQFYTYETFVNNYMPNAEIVFEYGKRYRDDVNNAGNEDFYFTEGYDWYSVYGSLGDWFFGERGALSFTIELSSRKVFFPSDDISHVWKEHKDAIINLFDIINRGFRGRILSIQNNEPVEAKIVMFKQSRNSKDPVKYSVFGYSDKKSGLFHIIADSSNYQIEITAQGFKPLTLNVSLQDYHFTGDIFLESLNK